MQLALLALGLAAQVQENPVSKVLTLLEDLQKKVLLDGEVEQKQYEKFADYCEDSAVKTQYEIKDGKAKAESLAAEIEKQDAAGQTADATIGDLSKTITKNSADLKGAQEIRDKENADFTTSDNDLAETIDMLARAVGIIEKNMKGASFAQVASKFKDVTDAVELVMQASVFSTKDKRALSALVQTEDDDFLEQPSGAPAAKAYESHSSSIVETLEDMKDKAEAMRLEGQKAEMTSKHNFDLLAQSLNDALKVDNKALDEAKAAKSAAAEAKALAEGDLSRTQKLLAENEKALSELSDDCQQKANDWAVSQKSRAGELQALTEARKIIGDMTGAATARAYGLLELAAGAASSDDAFAQVVKSLSELGQKTGDVALAQVAIRVKAATALSTGADVFAKVKGMLQELIDKLVQEAAEEADHKAWCDKEMGESRAKIEDHTSKLDKLRARQDKADAAIAKLTESIAATEEFLFELAKRQAEMDQMRKDEKAAYAAAKKDYEDGVSGLTMALQVLRDYYAQGDDASFIQQPEVSVHAAATGASTGIIGILEVAQADFTKLLADATVEEETAQRDYDKQSQENAVQKAMKGADLKYQQKEQASLRKNLAEYKEDAEQEQAELDAVTEYLNTVAPGCTVKPMTYEERKKRREAEIAGLKSALTILSGEAAEQPESFLALRSARRA